MSNFKVNERDIYFILREQLNYGDLCKLPRYSELDVETLDMLIAEAVKFAGGVVAPLQEVGDKHGVILADGKVSCAPGFREAFNLYGENGWIGASSDTEFGGQGFPHLTDIVINDIMYGACLSFHMCPSLTHGAAHLIESFGTQELKERYIPNMFGGRWSGTMCLTESQAGSNLAPIKTKASREGDHFKIKGTKIFISWGDHDLAENVIHLVLARIEGAPEGVKGLSLFVVPKVRVREDGSFGEPNDVNCAGVEQKLGIHASPTCVLNFGENEDCIGYLCGGENQGLPQMFQMMNSARINVGVAGIGVAATAYQNAVAYVKERVQGNDLARRKSGEIPIIDHPDIRRMLLWMKAAVDGMRSMAYATGYWLDLSRWSDDEKERVRGQCLVDFMTPIIKAYCSDTGFKVCEYAMQSLGGYGYTRDYPLEQYLRDAKILSIYEGTNGIQSMDLMGRKLILNGGAPIKAFLSELRAFCTKNADHPQLGEHVRSLAEAAVGLQEMAGAMTKTLQSDPLQWGSKTYPALLCFAEAAMVWRLLDMAVIARKKIDEGDDSDFYNGKVLQAKYFADVTLPTVQARAQTCVKPSREVIEMPDAAF
ncbi:MAG TPA: acyl-CoA dehydrogenase [Desulfomonilaceae bacterium]|nr:acyl-CoA dehydrogenase [Desulfomonilaceae bacterium]